MCNVICAASLMLLAGLTLPLLAASENPPGQSRLGINPSGIVDWNTEHPFVDVFRLSRVWISQRQGEPGFENAYRTNRFSPELFLNHWRAFNTIRFMDWMDTNG